MTYARASRHSRQTKLIEIGDAGQAKIAAATVEVRGSGPAAAVEARYLAGAGVGKLRVESDAMAEAARALDRAVVVVVDASLTTMTGADDASVAAFGLRDASARAVASGAHRALVHLRRALG